MREITLASYDANATKTRKLEIPIDLELEE